MNSTRSAIGLLLVRLLAGGAFVNHGWGKIQNPFHWMDKAAHPAPEVFQLLAAIAEFFGGRGLILGALTTVAAFGLICTMAVAIGTHLSNGDPFGKWELAAVYLTIAVLLILVGPGRFSLDAWVKALRPAATVPPAPP